MVGFPGLKSILLFSETKVVELGCKIENQHKIVEFFEVYYRTQKKMN